MTTDLVRQLDPIFKPKSVALVGASDNPSKWGGMVFSRMLASEFRGRLYPVNPKGREVFGLKAYTNVLEIPEPVDLVVFTIPAVHMPKAMESCVKKGIKAGVVISADFAETGEAGKALENETLEIARAGGLRFSGPNGNGLWTSAVGLNASPLPGPTGGPLAFVSQSGMFGGVVVMGARARGFGLSKFVSVGNQADLTFSDYVEYLGQDEDTKVIALYVEGFKDGRRFLNVARQVSRRKPILILKGGSSRVGARAALSHTASIAGEERIFDALCRQAGMIRVAQLEHLIVMGQALFSQPLPRGPRVAVIGNGGQGVTTVDNLAALGVEVPEFGPEDRIALKELLPRHAPLPRNPVDFAAGIADTMDEVRVLQKIASLDCIDGIITEVPMERTRGRLSLAERKKAVITAVDAFVRIPEEFGKPVVTQRLLMVDTTLDLLSNARIPVYDTQQECALAMSALIRYAEIKRRRDDEASRSL